MNPERTSIVDKRGGGEGKVCARDSSANKQLEGVCKEVCMWKRNIKFDHA